MEDVAEKPEAQGRASGPPISGVDGEDSGPKDNPPTNDEGLIYTEEIHGKEAIQRLNSRKESTFFVQQRRQPSPPPKKIGGIRLKFIYAALGALILMIAAVAGGVAGGLKARSNSQDQDAPPDAAVTGPPVMHPESQIAVTNWTDGQNQKNFVFYQDPQSSILVEAWDEKNDMWSSTNITARLYVESNRIDAKIGTPMAATSTSGHGFQVNLYFLDTNNKVVEVFSTDESLLIWQMGDLYTKSDIRLDDGSQMAAYWFACLPNCAGTIDGENQVRLFFAKSGHLQAYTGALWRRVGLSQVARNNSGVAAIAYTPRSGNPEMRLFFDTGSQLGMMIWKNDTGWRPSNSFAGTTHPTFEGQLIAASSFTVPNKANLTDVTLALQLERNGNLAATYWDPMSLKWNFGEPVTLEGGPANASFSTIASNNNRMFYGVADGEIYEYRIDPLVPTKFSFMTKVPLQYT